MTNVNRTEDPKYGHTGGSDCPCDVCARAIAGVNWAEKRLRGNPIAQPIEEPPGEWKDDPRTKRLAKLLLEARDALPAIPLVSAKLHSLDLTLADRIEDALEPWRDRT